MDNGHLTDEQLQEILDARMLHSGPILPLHLGACARCRERLDGYRRLYAGLAGDPGFVVPPSFADAVLAKISASPPPLWQRPGIRTILVAGAGAAVLAGLLIFVDMRPLANGARLVLAGLKSAFLPLGGQLKQLLPWLGGSAKPFLLGGLGLLIASILERWLQPQKLRHGH